MRCIVLGHLSQLYVKNLAFVKALRITGSRNILQSSENVVVLLLRKMFTVLNGKYKLSGREMKSFVAVDCCKKFLWKIKLQRLIKCNPIIPFIF